MTTHYPEREPVSSGDTGRELLLEALRLSEERYRTLLNNSGEAIFRVDLPRPVALDQPLEIQRHALANGVIIECNRAFLELFSASDERLFVGKKVSQVLDPLLTLLDTFIENHYHLQRRELGFTPDIAPHDARRESARQSIVELSCTGVIQEGQLVRFWGAMKDVTDSKRYLDMLAFQASHDQLTRLPNREYFRRIIKESLQKRGQQQQALLLFDLDKFKEINDTLGHNYGDRVLKNVATRITGCLMEGDVLCRLGGDEFAVYMQSCEDAQQAEALARLVESEIKQVIVIEGLQMSVGCSTGIALAPDHGQDAMSLLRCADIAMYDAKTRGNGPEIYNEEKDTYSAQRLALAADLGIAVRHDQLVLHYQPKIDLYRNALTGFEALVRWQHPEQGLVFPDKFIQIAEMTNLIKPLTRYVIEKSLMQLTEWREQGVICDVAVNLSARNLMDPGLVPFIHAMLEKYQVDAQYLQLEITESSLMTDPARAVGIITDLANMGIDIVVDDFGTGYSSLAYLKRMPVSTLKIDRSFVFNMLTDKQDDVIVSSTIQLAHNLGLSVVAEGVENVQAMDHLKQLGCDQVQGYYISRPIAADRVIPWIRQSAFTVFGQLDDANSLKKSG